MVSEVAKGASMNAAHDAKEDGCRTDDAIRIERARADKAEAALRRLRAYAAGLEITLVATLLVLVAVMQ
jgi:hypothetical protein